MKKLTYLLLFVAALGFASCPVFLTSCSTAPAGRVVQVQTLKAVGHSAEAVVASAAQLYAAGTISADQAKQITAFYDTKFQPAFRVAVTAVNSNLDITAPEDLVLLSTQLAALLLQFAPTK